MSDHVVGEHHGATADTAHAAGEHHHPGPAEYIKIGVILFVLTVIEVAVVYVPALSALLVPILMVLMAIKFALVVLWFMHLRFDNPLFSGLFTAPLFIALAITLALMALFGSFFGGGHATEIIGSGGGGH
jgi:cytochrome c oxidase subunit 4